MHADFRETHQVGCVPPSARPIARGAPTNSSKNPLTIEVWDYNILERTTGPRLGSEGEYGQGEYGRKEAATFISRFVAFSDMTRFCDFA